MSRPPQGFTLIELLVVMGLIAIATATVTLAVHGTADGRLEREATRLSALLESARAQSRASGNPIRWLPTANGFRFSGWPSTQPPPPAHWLAAGIVARATPTVLTLGPAPIIEASRITLVLGDRQRTLASDGLHPFVPVEDSR